MFARSMKPSRYPASLTSSRSRMATENGRRTLAIGNDISLTSGFRLPQDPKDQEGVKLLLGIATIVSKEIANSDKKLFDDGNDGDFLTRNKDFFVEPSITDDPLSTYRPSTNLPSILIKDNDFAWHRVRTVSIDNECGSPRRSPNVGQKQRSTKTKSIGLPAVVTPVGTRLRTVRKPSVKILAKTGKRDQAKFSKITAQQTRSNRSPNIMLQHKHNAMEQSTISGKSIITIHRKKFSWKNYPELESFLVANREEYLRHSALNYTIQQKKYNNCLTERLLDLAAQHLYVFSEDEFSFVTVRDRIRCFYKSYVQSSKKRGIVLGYAARKAGILTQADLQKSARKEGTIITPLEF